MTSLFLTFFLGSHLGVRADLFIAVTFGIKSGAQWKNFLGSTRTCVNDIDHPRSFQTPQLGHLYWQPSTLLGPAGDLKWFGMRANLLLPVIKLFSYSPSPAPFSLWVFAVPQKHWETHFAGECLSTLSWCQWHQRGHTTCSVLSWNRALGPVADGDRIAVLARDLQLSHPECHPPRWEKSLPSRSMLLLLSSFLNPSVTIQHNSHFMVVWEKKKLFSFSRGDPEERNFWASAHWHVERRPALMCLCFSSLCWMHILICLLGSRQGGQEGIAVILGGKEDRDCYLRSSFHISC